MRNIFMFSGQGAQYFQMGRTLFEHNRVFHDCMIDLDAVARRLSGESIVNALYRSERSKAEVFDRINLTHPAIFMVEYAMTSALKDAGVVPDCLLGVSLGTFTAAAVAGCLDPESALETVMEHASAVETFCCRGGMITVLGPIELMQEKFLRNNCDVAAVNSAEHFVVSAPEAQCQEIERNLTERRTTYVRLPVSYAFHSRWIEPARALFEASASRKKYQPASLPVMCCQQMAMLSELPPSYFWKVTREPIRFRESMEVIAAGGPNQYIDVGPAGNLAVLLKYLLPAEAKSAIHAVMTPYGRDMENFAAVTARARERHPERETWPSISS
ncbi:MAG: acyltransferase domain-containing protein [Terracidiphilus sp.]|jgi:acyl transferase domain-containing protein